MRNIIIVITVLTIFVGAGFVLYFQFGSSPRPVACTLEAKLCPDGSAVGRVGPKCEFAACPDEEADGEKGVLEGVMTIGPICPVEQVDNPCKPTPKMYAAQKIYISKSRIAMGMPSVIITPNKDGNFSVSLPVGTYDVDMVRYPEIGGISGVPTTVNIENGKTVHIVIDVDTGIR